MSQSQNGAAYLKEQGIDTIMTHLVRYLVEEQPADPVKAMHALVKSHNEAAVSCDVQENMDDIESKFPLDPSEGSIHMREFGSNYLDGKKRTSMLIKIRKGFKWSERMPKNKGGPMPEGITCCPKSHFGYLKKGKISMDMKEGSGHTGENPVIINAGECYFIAPQHDVTVLEDAEMLEFDCSNVNSSASSNSSTQFYGNMRREDDGVFTIFEKTFHSEEARTKFCNFLASDPRAENDFAWAPSVDPAGKDTGEFKAYRVLFGPPEQIQEMKKQFDTDDTAVDLYTTSFKVGLFQHIYGGKDEEVMNQCREHFDDGFLKHPKLDGKLASTFNAIDSSDREVIIAQTPTSRGAAAKGGDVPMFFSIHVTCKDAESTATYVDHTRLTVAQFMPNTNVIVYKTSETQITAMYLTHADEWAAISEKMRRYPGIAKMGDAVESMYCAVMYDEGPDGKVLPPAAIREQVNAWAAAPHVTVDVNPTTKNNKPKI